MNRLQFSRLLGLLVLLVPFSFPSLQAQEANPFAKGLVALEGPWEFYWQRFITEESEIPVPDTILPRIMVWNKVKLPEIGELPSFGYASYRMVIRNLGATEDHYILPPGGHYGAQRMTVRDLASKAILAKLSIGTIGHQSTKSLGDFGYLSFKLESPRDIEIIIETSNHHYFKGGMLTPPRLGIGQAAERQRLLTPIIDVIVLGILVSMFLFNIFFWLYQKELVSLLLAMSITMAILRLFTTLPLLYQYVDDSYFPLLHRLEYATVASFPIFSLYLDRIFPSRRWVRRLVISHFFLNSVYLVTLAFLPPFFYTKYLWSLQLSGLMVIMLGCIITFYALKAKARGSLINAFGILLLALGGYNDIILVSVLRVSNIYLTPWGMAAYVIFQSQIVAKRLADSNQLALALAQENSDYQSALRQEVESRFQIASDAAHHLNNPLNYIQTNLESVKSVGNNLQNAVYGLLGPFPAEDSEMRECQTMFHNKFSELFAPLADAERGIYLASSTVAKIRALSGVDGYERDRLVLTDKLKALQKHLELVVDKASFDRIRWEEASQRDATFVGNTYVFRFLIEQLLTRCLSVNAGAFLVSFLADSKREAVEVHVKFPNLIDRARFADLEQKFQVMCKPFGIEVRWLWSDTSLQFLHQPTEEPWQGDHLKAQ